jgi:hypothetical protein
MSANQPVFPYPGSYALHVDLDLQPPQPCELVRIQWRRQGFAAVAFPLREDGEPTKVVAESDLLDATPLDADERRELADLQRLLKDRIPRTAAMKARASGASSFACAAFGRGSCATSWPG